MIAAVRNPPFKHTRLMRWPKKRVQIAAPDDVVKFLGAELAGAATESFFVIPLDTKGGVLDVVEVSRGTVDASLVHPRDVYAVALQAMATSIIMAHNHPSGSPEPSPEDIALSKRIRDAGRLLGVPLLDHVIVGAEGHVSLQQRGVL